MVFCTLATHTRYLAQDETYFALEFLEYRQHLRQRREEKERLLYEDRERYQASVHSQYGISPSDSSVSTPPENGVFHTSERGVDTSEKKESGLSIPPLSNWKIFKPHLKKLEDTINLGISVINQLVMNTKEQVNLSIALSNKITIFCVLHCLE